MKRIMDKLREKKGETITETLVGVLIVGMGTAILVTGITSSLLVNKKARIMSENNTFSYVPTNGSGTGKSLTFSFEGVSVVVPVTEFEDNSNGKNYVWFTPKP